ncbi:hypothetical protein NPS01_40010 [Nocardioides psychrotolerans]|nr:hypothetical protein NPS01_40010 [Nocardioides psychrotolerans]
MLVLALSAFLVRLPFASLPLGPDEGGLLLVGSQWSPGTSLYGNYWVDRPPLLIGFFGLADHLGGTVALRLLGAVLVAISVLLAGRIGALAVAGGRGTRWAPALTALLTAASLVSSLVDALEVNGELIALPAILLSIERLLRAQAATTLEARTRLLLTAGIAAAAAVLVKQNEVDALLLIALLAARTAYRRGPRAALTDIAVPAAGAFLSAALVLGFASSRGTSLAGLWEAVVTFRLHASTVISGSASDATSIRLDRLLLSLAVTGAPVIIGLLIVRLRRRHEGSGVDLRVPALVLLTWECIAVLAGGSYWLHYLILLVPGLVLAVASICATPYATPDATPGPQPALRSPGFAPWDLLAVLSYVVAAALVATVVVAARTSVTSHADPLVSWLSTHQQPGDTAVVAYGHPDILRASGMASPYPEIWSLPVRVRDPGLLALTAVLAGTSRPDWVITTGASLAGWGIDPTTAQVALDQHYHYVGDIDGYRVFHQITPTGSPATEPTPCPPRRSHARTTHRDRDPDLRRGRQRHSAPQPRQGRLTGC